MSLSTRWAGDTHRALAGSSNAVQRLALALGPVRSVIRVIDDHVPPLAVDWAQVGKDAEGRSLSMSYTDFENGRIAVNPLPVLEYGETDPGRAVDISTGFGMHEASHGKHSRDRYKDLTIREDIIDPTFDHSDESTIYNRRTGRPTRDRPAFRPMRVATYLWNLVEDVRIEDETVKDWPGFAPYFDAVLGWVWHYLTGRRDIPTTYGPMVKDKLRVAFIACRFPNKADLMTRRTSVKASPVDPAEIAWWQAWQSDYLDGRTDVRETIRRGLDHLGEDPATEAEMSAMGEQEIREIEAGERLKAQIERLVREGVAGAYEVCVLHEGDARSLTDAEAAAVERLISEGLVAFNPTIFANGAECDWFVVTKPVETGDSRLAYIGRPDATVEALRAALLFRQELPQYDIKLQKSGQLDDAELHRWSMNDYRLFTEHVIEGRPDTFLGLLVDLSGSMDFGRKLPTAQRLAQLMLWALYDQPGIEMRVWGHSGDGIDTGAHVYRLWEPGDPLSRLGLIDTLYHGNNYDGYALAYCVEQVVDLPQPQKLIIVLSDGIPAGDHYGDWPAMRHVRHVAESARRHGVNVLQIAIDRDLRLPEQAAMYGPDNVVPFMSEAALPRQLGKVLGRWA